MTGSSEARPVLSARGLRKEFRVGGGVLRSGAESALVVDGVNLDVAAGETLGLVGESGSGKSTTARLVLRLLDPTSGTIVFDGEDITNLRGSDLRKVRRRMQAVFQDITGSLDEKMTVERIVGEPLLVHFEMRGAERRTKVQELLELVGLRHYHLDRYPYELSGGQRQRVALARSLAVEPKLLVLDEAVSALDVSTRAQVVNLLEQLQDRLGVAYLFIAHDLSVVHHISDRVGVMYLGQIVESGDAGQVNLRPRHPYTQALLSALPTTDPRRARVNKRIVLRGEVPSVTNLPAGCRFHTRCPYAMEICVHTPPPVLTFGDGGTVACHLHTEGPRLQGASVNELDRTAETTVAATSDA